MKNRLPGIAHYFPIKWKLIVYFLVFMLLMIFVSVYVNLGLKMSARFFRSILDEYQYLEVLGERVYAVQFYTENFLAEDSFDNLEKCLAAIADLRDSKENIAAYMVFTDQEAKVYSYLDLSNALGNLADLSEQTINARREDSLERTYADNQRLAAMSGVISKYLLSLIHRNTAGGNERFIRLTAQTGKIETLSYCLAVVIALLSIVFCINFSLGITQPLKQMVQNARQIGEGDFLVNQVSADSGDELQLIAEVFNGMSGNIHGLFQEIQKKARLETELKEEKMHTLEMENILRRTEIQMLQSQVNPHFLYNTLNAISQVAILEEAAETGKLIKNVAKLLRYNLQSLDRPVTVEDEINHIQEYLYIMGVRYGDQIACQLRASGDIGRCLLPCMTLQPILENAYIHGVAPLTDRPGRITVDLYPLGDALRVVIADNGVGMITEQIAVILEDDSSQPVRLRPEGSGSNGLGLANVRKRLELFYHQKELLTIASQPGLGAQVVLTLPIMEEVDL